MSQAHCCICNELMGWLDAETIDSIRGENVGEPLCDVCSHFTDAELSRRYDLNHKEGST